MMKRLIYFVVAVFLMISTAISAQVTTSAISGKVSSNGESIIGATVVATHTPSGTAYGTITNIDGRFNLPGMRVGGPYSVAVSYIGYGQNTTSGITLKLAETYLHNVVLTEETVTLNEVVVAGMKTKFTSERTGATTNISMFQDDVGCCYF